MDETPQDETEVPVSETRESAANIFFLQTVCDGAGPMMLEARDDETRARWNERWSEVLDAHDGDSLHAMLGVLRDTAYGLLHHYLGVGFKPGESNSYAFVSLPLGMDNPPPNHDPIDELAQFDRETLGPLMDHLMQSPAIQQMAASAEFRGLVDQAFGENSHAPQEETEQDGQDQA